MAGSRTEHDMTSVLSRAKTPRLRIRVGVRSFPCVASRPSVRQVVNRVRSRRFQCRSALCGHCKEGTRYVPEGTDSESDRGGIHGGSTLRCGHDSRVGR